jgi:hypothetical protein
MNVSQVELENRQQTSFKIDLRELIIMIINKKLIFKFTR